MAKLPGKQTLPSKFTYETDARKSLDLVQGDLLVCREIALRPLLEHFSMCCKHLIAPDTDFLRKFSLYRVVWLIQIYTSGRPAFIIK